MARRIAEGMLSSGDLSKIFGVTRVTLWQWRKGGLPYFRIGRAELDDLGLIMYDPVEVEKWAHENKKFMYSSPIELLEASTLKPEE